MKKCTKKAVSILAAISCLFSGSVVGFTQGSLPELHLIAAAAAYQEDGLQLDYQVLSDGTIEITKFIQSDATDITLPAVIDGVEVTSIGEDAFKGCKEITSITIPDGVTTIKEWAFADCEALKSIVIPDSVTTIEGWAFSRCKALLSVVIPSRLTTIENGTFIYCKALTSVTIPDSVASIGIYAFNDCSSLTSVIIPAGTTSVDVGAFSYCDKLTEIAVASDSPYYTSVDGVLFNKDMTELVCYPKGKQETTYEIPDSVITIKKEAFINCNLTSIGIPNSVTTIEECAFQCCTSLESITIPKSVKKVDDWMFRNCTSLKSVTISEGVTTVEGYAFYNCSSLTDITIPASVTSIGVQAFQNCTSLTDITIKNGSCKIDDLQTVPSTTITIHGYAGSTAETYANHRNEKFVPLSVETQQMGDPNGDGVVSVEDAVLTLTIYAQKSAGLTVDCSEAQLAAADIDGDGNISVEDAIAILTYYAKQSAGLNPTWD